MCLLETSEKGFLKLSFPSIRNESFIEIEKRIEEFRGFIFLVLVVVVNLSFWRVIFAESNRYWCSGSFAFATQPDDFSLLKIGHIR